MPGTSREETWQAKGKPKSRAATKETPPADGGTGIEAYMNFVFEFGHPEWIVLCGEVPADALAGGFAALVKAERRLEKVPVKPAKAPPRELFPSLVPVVQVEGTLWASVLWITAWPIDGRLIDEANKAAKKLSASLKARTLTFMGEDTAGACALHVFDRGKEIEHKEWLDDARPPAFVKSSNLYIPPCFVMKRGEDLKVGAPPEVSARIVRADVVDIGDDPY